MLVLGLRPHPGVVRAVLACALMVGLSACQIELHSKLKESEANEMMARLMQAGIGVSKTVEKEGISLLVEESEFGRAVDFLAKHGLPREEFVSVGDVFNSDGLIASPLQEWARFNFAKSQELSQSIRDIPGVVKASVHIAETRSDGPFDETTPPSASVLLQIQAHRIPTDLVPQIKQLVSFSIPNIDYDRVGVIVSPIHVDQKPKELVTFLGFVMHPKSAAELQKAISVIAVGGLALMAFAGAAVFWFIRSRASKLEVK